MRKKKYYGIRKNKIVKQAGFTRKIIMTKMIFKHIPEYKANKIMLIHVLRIDPDLNHHNKFIILTKK